MLSQKWTNVKRTSPYVNAFLFILLPFFCGISCSSSPSKAPISSVSQPAKTHITHHVVAKGDTLYAIAWRYNLDYKNLSKINNINPPYSINPGQIIQLHGVAPRVSSVGYTPKTAPLQPSKKSTKASSVKPKNSSSKSQSPKKSTSSRSEKRTVRVEAVKAPPVSSGSLVWFWPVKGRVISPFSVGGKLNKGIDIAAKLGESVRAAADGEVVYAGSGLRGYGNLIIIKHKNSYLSAYAHNSKLTAKEGDVVKMRDKIAEVGGSGTTAVKLHFEIRKDGVPVDPLKYLPQ